MYKIMLKRDPKLMNDPYIRMYQLDIIAYEFAMDEAIKSGNTDIYWHYRKMTDMSRKNMYEYYMENIHNKDESEGTDGK